MVWLDTYQLAYQNYKQGNLSKEFYFGLQKSWDWVPNERNLSAVTIKCFVYVIWGVDQSGNWAVMIDSNNNLDFGDEQAFQPEVIDPRKLESYKRYTKPVIVRCEKVQRGKIVSTQIPIIIKLLGGDFVYNFPRYASAKLNVDGEDFSILISSQNFTSPSFTKTTIARVPPETKDYNIEANDLIQQNQILNLGNLISTKKYKNLGVDWGNEVLSLEGVGSDSIQNQNVIQAGNILEPFEGQEFSTGKTIALNTLKGKYVYIDFWGTWCRGCVLELPEIKKIYNKFDRSQVEFVGIAYDTPLNLKKAITNSKLGWPQILSDSVNKLVEKYRITGFPTSILLDKEGRIIQMNLRPGELEEKLNTLVVQ